MKTDGIKANIYTDLVDLYVVYLFICMHLGFFLLVFLVLFTIFVAYIWLLLIIIFPQSILHFALLIKKGLVMITHPLHIYLFQFASFKSEKKLN